MAWRWHLLFGFSDFFGMTRTRSYLILLYNYEISSDQKTYTIHLKQTIWHDKQKWRPICAFYRKIKDQTQKPAVLWLNNNKSGKINDYSCAWYWAALCSIFGSLTFGILPKHIGKYSAFLQANIIQNQSVRTIKFGGAERREQHIKFTVASLKIYTAAPPFCFTF